MIRMTMILALLTSCATDDLGAAEFAIDTDQSGTVDCADLDHVITCIEHPDPHVCAHADVTGDGVVDDADAHAIHDGLVATHHDCTEPTHHHDAAH